MAYRGTSSPMRDILAACCLKESWDEPLAQGEGFAKNYLVLASWGDTGHYMSKMSVETTTSRKTADFSAWSWREDLQGFDAVYCGTLYLA